MALVTWSIDIDEDDDIYTDKTSPDVDIAYLAAFQARMIDRDPNNIALYYEVTLDNGKRYGVDLYTDSVTEIKSES